MAGSKVAGALLWIGAYTNMTLYIVTDTSMGAVAGLTLCAVILAGLVMILSRGD